jgi:hypothetical protein
MSAPLPPPPTQDLVTSEIIADLLAQSQRIAVESAVIRERSVAIADRLRADRDRLHAAQARLARVLGRRQ